VAGLVSIESLAPAPKLVVKPVVKKVEEREEVGSFGD
jgi:hypothetical protein